MPVTRAAARESAEDKMNARARDIAAEVVPPPVQRRINQMSITVGREYEIHAVVVYEGLTIFQLVDDTDYPAWIPAWVFVPVDGTIPGDWICTFVREDYPSLILGPEFVANSVADYEAMVELKPHKVDAFWERVMRLEETAR